MCRLILDENIISTLSADYFVFAFPLFVEVYVYRWHPQLVFFYLVLFIMKFSDRRNIVFESLTEFVSFIVVYL